MTFRLLVTGSRDWSDGIQIHHEFDCIKSKYGTDVVVAHGGATGADYFAASEASNQGWKVQLYRADWKKYGKAAGPIRNQQMLDEFKPDYVLAFPLRGSVGTVDMMQRVVKAGIPMRVVPPTDDELAL